MKKSQSRNNNLASLRKRAEEKIKQTPGKASVSELHHELTVHEIELEMQNAELRDTQEKLHTALQEYSELFELSPAGYFILDPNGKIDNVNNRGCEQLDYAKEKILGRSFFSFLNTEFDRDNFYRHKNVAILDGTLERLECEMKKKGGIIFSALVKSKVVRDQQNEFKHLLCMVTDISSLREHERQVEMQLVKAEELNLMKSRFIAVASHEFRTPLTSILSSTTLIEQYANMGNLEKITWHLNRIKGSIKILITILEDFLSLEKLESGKVEVHATNFHFPDFCNDMIEESAGVKKPGQSISYIHKGEAQVTGDKKILQHILLNLLSNGCKYSAPEQEIQLSTEVAADQVTITITDQGIGIPEAEHENVFSRFFRARNIGNIQGTGLGLNIVKRYVQLLNGRISFVSKENEGTTFIVEFPRHQPTLR